MDITAIHQIFLTCTSVTTDSRNCPQGSLFIALKGESFNGNAFAARALESGSAYAIVDEEAYAPEGDTRYIVVENSLKTLQQLANYHRRQMRTPIIGITGTNGKTTTKELMSTVLSQTHNVLYTLGNLNNHIGVPLTLLRLRALLDDRLLNTPAVAVERARSATAEMAELARVGVMQAMSLTHEWNDTLAQKVREEETQVDRYEDALGTYLVKLSSRELNHADSQSVNTLLHTISDFERISDHSVNLMESAEEMHTKEIQFSQDARDELQVLEDAVQDILNRTTDAFRKGDLHLASKVEPLEAVVNELVRAIKAHHIARLQAGSCSIEYGFVLDDLLTNYERVCDHCSNVAVAQIEVAQDSFDTHAYLNELRHGNDTKESEEFHRRLDRYRERYLFPENQSAEDFDK